jgi:hypothetical protein
MAPARVCPVAPETPVFAVAVAAPDYTAAVVNARYAYCGVLDDFAARVHDGQPIQKLDELNDHLIRAVLAGDRLIINDGYILMNPAVQQAIIRPQDSPFRSLFQSEFIMIVSRNGGDLPGLCAHMAKAGITSAIDLLKSPLYKQELEPALAAWSAELNSSDVNWSRAWPAHKTDYLYGKLSGRVLESLIAATPKDEQLQRFRDDLGEKVTSRTAWENIANSLHASDQLSVENKTILMAGANEAYQYTWGCNLTDKNNPMSVQARASAFLDDLNQPVGEAGPRARPGVRVFVPNVSIAGKGIRRNWELLAQVASRRVGGAAAAKKKFRDDLEAYYTGQGITQKQMQASARAYSESLAAIFGRDKKLKTGVDLFFTAVGTGATIGGAVGLLPGAAAGAAIGIGIGVAGFAVPRLPITRDLISRLGQTKPRKWISELDPQDPQNCVSSFELDPEKVALNLKGVPVFKS